MSADWWLSADNCHADHSWNVTYNLSPMLSEAGWSWPDRQVWSKEYLEGATAADIGEKAMYVLRNLEGDPERFKALNPPNGWGDYDGLVSVWRNFVETIREHPEGRIGVWF